MKSIAARGAIMAVILSTMVLIAILIIAMGILLIPYNVVRVTAWVFEKVIEGLAAAINFLEQTI